MSLSSLRLHRNNEVIDEDRRIKSILQKRLKQQVASFGQDSIAKKIEKTTLYKIDEILNKVVSEGSGIIQLYDKYQELLSENPEEAESFRQDSLIDSGKLILHYNELANYLKYFFKADGFTEQDFLKVSGKIEDSFYPIAEKVNYIAQQLNFVDKKSITDMVNEIDSKTYEPVYELGKKQIELINREVSDLKFSRENEQRLYEKFKTYLDQRKANIDVNDLDKITPDLVRFVKVVKPEYYETILKDFNNQNMPSLSRFGIIPKPLITDYEEEDSELKKQTQKAERLSKRGEKSLEKTKEFLKDVDLKIEDLRQRLKKNKPEKVEEEPIQEVEQVEEEPIQEVEQVEEVKDVPLETPKKRGRPSKKDSKKKTETQQEKIMKKAEVKKPKKKSKKIEKQEDPDEMVNFSTDAENRQVGQGKITQSRKDLAKIYKTKGRPKTISLEKFLSSSVVPFDGDDNLINFTN